MLGVLVRGRCEARLCGFRWKFEESWSTVVNSKCCRCDGCTQWRPSDREKERVGPISAAEREREEGEGDTSVQCGLHKYMYTVRMQYSGV